MSLVQVRGLKKYFPIKGGLLQRTRSFVHAVDGVSFEINSGETFGLVGESGCGKTTCGNCITKILEPTGGDVYFDGRGIFELSRKEMKDIRPLMQVVFQDPYSSLNPRKNIRQILSDPFKLHTSLKRGEIEKEVDNLIKRVGLSTEHLYRYPYEFSGGQRQRIAIARAIATRPTFIFLDEPTSSVDVSVQAQILNLLNDLQREYNLTFLFVTHDIHIIRYMANRVAVMYLGKIMELAHKEDMFEDSRHPYSQALFSAVPEPNPEVKRKRIILSGETPTPIDPSPGCRFCKRCWLAKEGLCDVEEPELVNIGNDHFVACHLVN